MLIRLDESLFDAVNSFNLSEIAALVHLATASREGNHVVLASKRLASKLASLKDLGKLYQSEFNRICENFSTLSSIDEHVSFYALVTRDSITDHRFCHDKRAIQLPLEHFSKSKSVQKTILLCENFNDCVFYHSASRLFARANQYYGILQFDFRGAGGSAMAQEVRNILSDKMSILLVISDSDKKFDFSNVGDTAKEASKALLRSDSKLAAIHIIAAREAENLIPDAFFEQHFKSDPQFKRNLAFFHILKKTSFSKHRLYMEIPAGLKASKLLASYSDDQFKAFWHPLLSHIESIKDSLVPLKPDCLHRELCSSEDCCSCFQLHPSGKALLEPAASFYDKQKRDFPSELTETMSNALHQLTLEMISWGCGAPPRKT